LLEITVFKRIYASHAYVVGDEPLYSGDDGLAEMYLLGMVQKQE